jgi:hypothetical protein
LVTVSSIPAFAQESNVHTVSFDSFSFSYADAIAQNINISHYPGDPVEGAGPGFSDAPNTIFNLYNAAPAPESPLDAHAGIRLYATADLAQYDFTQAAVDQLQTLVTEQLDLSAYESSSGETVALPFLPIPLNRQTLIARAEYVETEQLRGITYVVTSPTLAAIEPFTSASFNYVFQGISTDGQFYILAIFKLTTSLFPEVSTMELADVSANWDSILVETAVTLDEAAPGDFSSSLNNFHELIESFSFTAE